MADDKKFSEWHGVPRDKIKWNPKVDEKKCVGCGMCVTTCGRGVFKFDYENRKSKVVNPNNCMIACQTCANLCPVGAISFVKEGETTREKAQRIVKETNVLAKVGEELEKREEELRFKIKTAGV
jgi:formate hydrogenlyase subunit 6/NADH:ubiquinone oxidoreductase subunit I